MFISMGLLSPNCGFQFFALWRTMLPSSSFAQKERHMRRFGKVTLSILFALTAFLFPSAQAQTYQVIHSFTGGLDGANPEAGLTMDRAGNLYGTTYNGGRSGDCPFGYPNSGCGTVFLS